MVAEEEEGEEAGPVLRFRSSDFAVSDHVSVGLQGRVRSNFLGFEKWFPLLRDSMLCVNAGLLSSFESVHAFVVGRGDL